MYYDWNLKVLLDPKYVAILLTGLGTTLALTSLCIGFGTLLGLFLGGGATPWRVTEGGRIPSSSRVAGVRHAFGVAHGALRGLCLAYIDVVRAVPLLLLILTTYYLLPVLVSSGPVAEVASWFGATNPFSVTGFQCAAVAMVLNLAAFIGDLVRGAAAGVPQGSVLAARALGMNRRLTWRRVVLPEILRSILPSLVLLYITMLKMSTLASAIAVQEVLHAADAVIQETYRPLELYLALCMIFVAIIVPATSLARRLENSAWFRRRS